ncbi:MAG: NAD(P)/FAD-dependent oxidoreductase [Bacteroidetes bacterium]|nr:NAD(P)/FAD-dependent oxidoreductase [Bacteroidota bacterium]
MAAERVPVCIIGAGPAGATTALFLAQKGIPHLLLDAAEFPRDKICGDGLDLKVIRVLRHANPDWVDELMNHPDYTASWGTRFFTQNGKVSDFIYTPRVGDPYPLPLFLTAKRLHFDHFLVQKLDARCTDFRPASKVTQLDKTPGGWRIQVQGKQGPTEIETPLVIGADGDHSVVLRALGERAIHRGHYAGALRQYWDGVADLHPKNLIEVYFPKNLPMSYFYIFPLAHGLANVGYGMVSSIISKNQYKLQDLMAGIIEKDPVMAPRFKNATPLEKRTGWGIPLASLRRKSSGDGYLLAGDAASLVCPTSGEGIGTAMVSGYIAAQFTERALLAKRYDANVFVGYDKEIYRRLESEIRLYNWMMRISPKVYDAGLNFLAPNALFKWSFQKRVQGWLRTAYETPIRLEGF